MLADAREAMTALDAALADSGWQAGWGAQIESVQSRQCKETQRVYQAVWQEKSFVPEIDDHLDRESVYREFRQITDSTLTQSSVLGVLNETLPAEAVIVAAAGSLPGDLQRVWRNRAEKHLPRGVRLLLHGIRSQRRAGREAGAAAERSLLPGRRWLLHDAAL
ncbi:hypothetical protein LNP05_05350 [Klebsiella pneumoniae subsp. pneumoniae]|nr:hypothetical protein [Klebsiella pneumoniae subsp. pneumoniae]